jgi:hypothetical protein
MFLFKNVSQDGVDTKSKPQTEFLANVDFNGGDIAEVCEISVVFGSHHDSSITFDDLKKFYTFVCAHVISNNVQFGNEVTPFAEDILEFVLGIRMSLPTKPSKAKARFWIAFPTVFSDFDKNDIKDQFKSLIIEYLKFNINDMPFEICEKEKTMIVKEE